MLSKIEIKLIRSLENEKYRTKHGLCIAETPKVIEVLLQQNIIFHCIYAIPLWVAKNKTLIKTKKLKVNIVSEEELKKISFLKTPHNVAGIAYTTPYRFNSEDFSSLRSLNNNTFILDNIRDPGNLGTILRTAAWFGIKNIVCSPDCVDLYHPKVVQGSMGYFSKININYCNLVKFLSFNSKIPVFGTFTTGTPLHEIKFIPPCFIIFGNESHGIRKELFPFIMKKIAISNPTDTDSLNVAVAFGIVCYEQMD